MLTFVDDINYANSNIVQIKKAAANLRCMEKCKELTFKKRIKLQFKWTFDK